MYIVGIDFGTTNSCISYYDGSNIKIIQNDNGNYTTPSYISFSIDSSEILFGSIQNKDKYTIINNFKRLIGIRYIDFKNNDELVNFFKSKNIEVVSSLENEYCSFKILYNNIYQYMDIEEITTKYIQYLLDYTRNVIEFKDVVITVPVYFNDIQRSILKNIFQSFNINVIRIINEPTAAALAYSSENTNIQNEKILVIDCGGGTTDFSILEMDYTLHIYRVIDVIGDNFLGGEDITKLLADFISTKLHRQTINKMKLNKEAENIKHKLSFINNTPICIDGFDLYDNISKTKFEYICDDFFKKFTHMLINFTKSHSDIDKVIFVGGTTRIPKIKTICKNILPKSQINNIINPDHTISIGASIQGYLLSNPENLEEINDILLLDVVNISLGVESDGGIMNVIIPKNTTIPVKNTMYFTNEEDYISDIDIHIYQGERKLIKYNNLLSTLKLTGLNKDLLQGQMNIKIDFIVDSDGILKVLAYEKHSDTLSEIKLDKINNSSHIEVNTDDIFDDTYRANQIKYKNILYKKFKEFLTIFRKRNYRENSFELLTCNTLFNKIFNIIYDFSNYSPTDLENTITQFETDFHNINIINSFDDI